MGSSLSCGEPLRERCFRRRKKKIANAINATKARAPMTPPAMAPAGVLFLVLSAFADDPPLADDPPGVPLEDGDGEPDGFEDEGNVRLTAGKADGRGPE